MLNTNEIFVVMIATIISSAFVSLSLPKIVLLSLKKKFLDGIDHRKIHTKSASRLGGITFLPAIFISVFLCTSLSNIFGIATYTYTNDFIIEMCATCIIFITGLYDDVIGLKYHRKFALQIFVSALIVLSGTYINSFNGLLGIWEIPSYVGIPLTLVLIVFITNAINLIDGIDGLAASLSIMALFCFGYLFSVSFQSLYVIISFATLGVVMSFLYNNLLGIRKRSETKIFMGDSGSFIIGFILSFLTIKLWNAPLEFGDDLIIASDYFPSIAFTVLIIPCFDVVRVILYRYKRHKPLFIADKSHFHHKLLALGMSSREALKVLLLLNLFFVVVNIILTNIVSINVIVAIDVLIWSIIHVIITKRIRENTQYPTQMY